MNRIFPAIPNGQISVNSSEGKIFGFTADRFCTDSYLWRRDDTILILSIESEQEGCGYFSGLVKAIESKGFYVEIVTPVSRMRKILKHWGFERTKGWDEEHQCKAEVWKRSPEEKKDESDIDDDGDSACVHVHCSL